MHLTVKKNYFLFLFFSVITANAQNMSVFNILDGAVYWLIAPSQNLSLEGTDMGEGSTRYYLYNTDPDQSTTNEIELPSQASQSGKFLTTNGTSPSWSDISTTISAPSTGNAITSGTAFQPRSGGACNIVINSSLGSGLAAVTGTIIIAMSSTQSGTYTTVTTDGLILSLLNSSLDRSSATIPVPSGYWVKVTNSTVGVGASISSTYTRWNL